MTQPEKAKPSAKASEPKKALVRTPSGQMVHLFTNTVFTADPTKVEIDSFVQSQLDAGKLVVAED